MAPNPTARLGLTMLALLAAGEIASAATTNGVVWKDYLAVGMTAPKDESLKATFDEQWADAERGVWDTHTRKDDATLADTMLDAAHQADGAMSILLYERTYYWGKRSLNLLAAARSAGSVARLDPDRQFEMRQRLLDIYVLAFRTAKGSASGDIDRKLQYYYRAAHATSELMLQVARGRALTGDLSGAQELMGKSLTIAKEVAQPAAHKGAAVYGQIGEVKDLVDTIRQDKERVDKLALLYRRIKSKEQSSDADPADVEKLTAQFTKDLDEFKEEVRGKTEPRVAQADEPKRPKMAEQPTEPASPTDPTPQPAIAKRPAPPTPTPDKPDETDAAEPPAAGVPDAGAGTTATVAAKPPAPPTAVDKAFDQAPPPVDDKTFEKGATFFGIPIEE